jgi:5'-3' exonuclease
MGIPHLYGALGKMYPRAFLSRRAAIEGARARRQRVRVLVDFNAVAHSCLNEDEGAPPPQLCASAALRVTEIAALWDEAGVDAVAAYADGTPPVAKLEQQRERRAGGTDARNALTCGTELMMAAMPLAMGGGGGVEYSGADQPGEGEQKLFRALESDDREGAAYVVVGQDADLILMALTARVRPTSRVLIDRWPDDRVVDVGELARCVAASGFEAPLDFAGLCFLCGTDFVPPLTQGGARDGGLRRLVAAHARADHPRLLDPATLEYEARALADVACAMGGGAGYAGGGVRQHRREVMGMGEFTCPVEAQAAALAAVDEYVAGLAWTASYLCARRSRGDAWHYPWAAAPHVADISLALGTARASDGGSWSARIERVLRAAEDEQGPALRALQAEAGRHAWQLLMVLPPRCAHLVPDARLSALMASPDWPSDHAGDARVVLDAVRAL